MKRIFLLRALAVIVGAVFVYAGFLKALDPAQFALDIQNYRIPFLPWIVCALAAVYLPWLEILCGAALIFNRAKSGALWLTTAMMLIFLAAMISAKARGLDIACGCFGHETKTSSHSFFIALARDAALLAALGVLLFHDRAARQKKFQL